MKKITRIIPALLMSAAILLNISGTIVSAQFSDSGKHWYYSDDVSFKYWRLTEVNENGIPVDSETLSNINFDGATPANTFKIGQEDYLVTAYVYEVPTNINVKISMRGDVTSDGKVNIYDAIFIAGYLVNRNQFSSEFHEFTGDYNTDGHVDLYDTIDICKMILQQTVVDQSEEIKQRDEFINEVFRLVNVERASAGLKPLTLDTRLCTAAQKRAVEISTQKDIEHTRPDGTDCFTVLDEMKISYYYAGENIAGGYLTPEAVVQGWMNSEGHRANILDPYFNKIGIGFYKKDNSTYQYYWSQFFIQDEDGVN